MKLHLDKQLFKDATTVTAQQLDILPIYVEKDYWVTYALHTIFNNEIGKETIFKGGTALSKCYNLINRFSEDIDLVVLRGEGETDAKLKNKIRTICKVVEAHLPEVYIEGLTHKMGMNRKTAHSYTKEFQGNYGQIRDVIVIESTWLGYCEPYTSRHISSFIGNMMLKNGQTGIAEENGMLNFHPCEALIFSNLESTWSELKTTYNGDFKELVFGEFPNADDIHKTLNLINERLSTIKWTVKVDEKH